MARPPYIEIENIKKEKKKLTTQAKQRKSIPSTCAFS